MENTGNIQAFFDILDPPIFQVDSHCSRAGYREKNGSDLETCINSLELIILERNILAIPIVFILLITFLVEKLYILKCSGRAKRNALE